MDSAKSDQTPRKRLTPARETSPAREDKPPRLVHAPVRIPGQRRKTQQPTKYPAGYWLG
jgi:hypothetical protein